MNPKYFIDDIVRFVYEGKQYTGRIQGLRQGTGKANGDKEPLYFIWAGDQVMWVRESWIVEIS